MCHGSPIFWTFPPRKHNKIAGSEIVIVPQVSSSNSKTQVNTAIFGPSFTEYLKEKIKKYVRVSTETSF